MWRYAVQIAGIVTGCFSLIVLIYKLLHFVHLWRSGKLRTNYRNLKGFLRLLAFGSTSDIVDNAPTQKLIATEKQHDIELSVKALNKSTGSIVTLENLV
jgi:hypothetical protein